MEKGYTGPTHQESPQEPGHRLVPHATDRIIEAWGPDRVSCLGEAMRALVEVFTQTPDEVVSRLLPISVERTSDEDLLVSLLEEEISVIDVFSVVPVRFHLAETEDGGVVGDMEVIDAGDVEFVGPVPKAVSHQGLEMGENGGGWRCRAVLDA